MSLVLISYHSLNELHEVRQDLRRLESRTADQTSLAIITATIYILDQSQSIPAHLGVRALELAETCLSEVQALPEVVDLRKKINRLAGIERINLSN